MDRKGEKHCPTSPEKKRGARSETLGVSFVPLRREKKLFISFTLEEKTPLRRTANAGAVA